MATVEGRESITPDSQFKLCAQIEVPVFVPTLSLIQVSTVNSQVMHSQLLHGISEAKDDLLENSHFVNSCAANARIVASISAKHEGKILTPSLIYDCTIFGGPFQKLLFDVWSCGDSMCHYLHPLCAAVETCF
jgi:hypothetical protein